jgi:hypothetical protein
MSLVWKIVKGTLLSASANEEVNTCDNRIKNVSRNTTTFDDLILIIISSEIYIFALKKTHTPIISQIIKIYSINLRKLRETIK